MATTHNRVSAQLITLCLALQAKQGEADAVGLGQAVVAVIENFGAADPLAQELRSFAARFPTIRRDPELLSAAGEQLFRAVERSSWPSCAARADIEG